MIFLFSFLIDHIYLSIHGVLCMNLKIFFINKFTTIQNFLLSFLLLLFLPLSSHFFPFLHPFSRVRKQLILSVSLSCTLSRNGIMHKIHFIEYWWYLSKDFQVYRMKKEWKKDGKRLVYPYAICIYVHRMHSISMNVLGISKTRKEIMGGYRQLYGIEMS